MTKRPYVICHMVPSVDGRILTDGWPLPQGLLAEYERIAASFEADAWIIGRVSMEPYAGKARLPTGARGARLPRTDFVARSDAPSEYDVGQACRAGNRGGGPLENLHDGLHTAQRPELVHRRRAASQLRRRREARRGTPQKPQDLLQHDCICARTSLHGARYAWELERGSKTWRVPVEGTVTTNDTALMRVLGVAGVGLLYMFEPELADDLRQGSLRLVLEPYAAAVPGFFLYFPSRAQVSPALRALVDVAREMAGRSRRTS